MKWIKIEDAQPKDGEVVITYFKYNHITGIEVALYKNLKGTENEIFGHHCFTNKSGYLTDDVTHWMPLPPLPVEGVG